MSEVEIVIGIGLFFIAMLCGLAAFINKNATDNDCWRCHLSVNEEKLSKIYTPQDSYSTCLGSWDEKYITCREKCPNREKCKEQTKTET